MSSHKSYPRKNKSRGLDKTLIVPNNKFWERPVAGVEERQKILIYCEGKNTEPSYFPEI